MIGLQPCRVYSVIRSFFLVLYRFLQWIIHYGELVIECRREHEPVALIVMHPSA